MPAPSCVSTKSTSSALRWLNVLIILSGGTTDTSLRISAASRAVAMTCSSIASFGFITSPLASRYHMYRQSGYLVSASRMATTAVQEKGAPCRS